MNLVESLVRNNEALSPLLRFETANTPDSTDRRTLMILPYLPQNSLHIVGNWCKNSALDVNLGKTKMALFKAKRSGDHYLYWLQTSGDNLR